MKTFKTLSVALIIMLFGAGLVSAEFCRGQGQGQRRGPMGKGGMKIFRILRTLDLSYAQKDQVKEIIDNHAEERKKIIDNLKQSNDNLSKSIYADAYNETNIKNAHSQVSQAKEKMVLLNARIVSEIKPLLTPAQLEKLKTIQPQGPSDRMAGNSECRGRGFGNTRGCRFMGNQTE